MDSKGSFFKLGTDKSFVEVKTLEHTTILIYDIDALNCNEIMETLPGRASNSYGTILIPHA